MVRGKILSESCRLMSVHCGSNKTYTGARSEQMGSQYPLFDNFVWQTQLELRADRRCRFERMVGVVALDSRLIFLTSQLAVFEPGREFR